MVDLVEDEGAEEDDVGGRSRWLIALLGLMLRRPQDTLAAGVASAALIAILVNALFLQPNPHPAPLFSVRPKPRPAATLESTGVVVLPRPRPADIALPRPEPAAKPLPVSRPRSDIITDIQRELTRRGFYDGAVDGIHGSRTAAAIRGLERTTGTAVGAEPGEAMLQAILRAPAAAAAPSAPRRADPIGDLVARTGPQDAPPSPLSPAAAVPESPIASSARFEPNPAPSEPSRPQPGVTAVRPEPVSAPARTEVAALPTRQEPGTPAAPVSLDRPVPAEHPVPRADLPSPQVKAVQRALSEFGYGQLSPTGIVDAATAAAIRDFEEARDLPITGQMSDRMVQELATVTGRGIE